MTSVSRAKALILLRKAVDASSSVPTSCPTSALQGIVGQGELVVWVRWVVPIQRKGGGGVIREVAAGVGSMRSREGSVQGRYWVGWNDMLIPNFSGVQCMVQKGVIHSHPA